MYSCLAQGIELPMCEHDVLEISMPFIAGHDLREFSRDATAYVATQARKAKMEISSRTHERRHEKGR